MPGVLSTTCDRACRRSIPATKRLRLSKLSTISDTAASTAAKRRRLDGAPHLQLATGTSLARMMAGSTSVSWLNPRWYRLSERCFLINGKVAEHGLEPLVELGAFLGSPGRSDGLGVFAQAHQAEAEIGLAPDLPEIEPDEWRPNRYSAPKVPSSAYTAKNATSVCEMDAQHRAERDQLHQRAQEDEQEVRGRPVKVLMSSLMRWSGLSMSRALPMS